MRKIIFAGALFWACTAMAQAPGAANFGILQNLSIFQADRGALTPAGPDHGQATSGRASVAAPVLLGTEIEVGGPATAILQFLEPLHAKEFHEGDSFSWGGSTFVVREITWDGISISGGDAGPGLIRAGMDLMNQAPPLNSPRAGVAPMGGLQARGRDLTRPGVAGSGPAGVIVFEPAPGGVVPRDEPLPLGAADDLAGRMRLRRQTELATGE